MRENVFQKDWFAVFKVKVTVKDHIIKVWLSNSNISSELLILLQLNLIWWHIIVSWIVLWKDWIAVFWSGQGHKKGSKFQWMFIWMLSLNCLTLCNQTWYGDASSWARDLCNKISLLSSSSSLISSYLSLNHEGCWGTTDNFATSFLHFFPVLHCPLGLGRLQACPFPDVVFPLLPLSAVFSSRFHCALLDGFGQTWWTVDITIPLQFATLYDGQEVFMWSHCLLDLGMDSIVGNMVFVWDA